MENDPKVQQIVNALTPEQKLNAAMRLYWSARELKTAALRSLHPDWPEDKIQQEVRHTLSSPPADNLFLLFTRKFDELASPYMVSGSVAAMIYGEPRLTNDVDLVVFLDQRAAIRLPQLFPATEFYCPPPDVIAIEIAREFRGHFNIVHIDSGFKADVYLRGRDPLHIWALERSRRIQVGDARVAVAPLEYVIIRKLEYFREGGSQKHLRDIQGILRSSPGAIDTPKLNSLIEERSLGQQWAQVRATQM